MGDTRESRGNRTIITVLVLTLAVVIAGCTDVGGPGGGANETTAGQVTEPVETTQEPTETTPEATPQPTDEPAGTESPAAGGGDGGGSGGESSGLSTALLLGALGLLVVGIVAVSLFRGRSDSKPSETTGPAVATDPTSETRSGSEQVISLLHRNNGRMFLDVLEEELGWSPARTRRVLDGLVATGDVEVKETDRGELVAFTEPT